MNKRELAIALSKYVKNSRLLKPARPFLRWLYYYYAKKKRSISLYLFNVIPRYNRGYEWTEPALEMGFCDLAIVIAFRGRHKVLKAVVSELFSAQSIGIGLVLACSNEEDVAVAMGLRQNYKRIGVVRCDNQPLGNKWHIAVECARKLSPKAIMITGSDDLVSSDYLVNNFNILMQDPFGGLGMVGPRVWYVADLTLGLDQLTIWRVAYCNEKHLMPLGAGRMYKATYLDTVDWKIFERNWPSMLDDKGYYDVLANDKNVYCPTLDDGFVISLKGKWVAMNPLEEIISASSISAVKVDNEEGKRVMNRIKASLMMLND
ncbi:hypothetical protein FE236_07865 [Mariprofundus erugo]|uniref:hypothetical protein n=1 Tax=Mariprofundus erugo TaxID=2528639 RepID=UPI0010FE27C3|nr:hypothetical protein [Mariprofundus erugo]TLS76040.1 hypothetical protein FE236_07865 [Mariprofundus erugo]